MINHSKEANAIPYPVTNSAEKKVDPSVSGLRASRDIEADEEIFIDYVGGHVTDEKARADALQKYDVKE